MASTTKKLLGIGNPLLDISAVVPMEVLTKYGVSLNSACLAEEKHLPLYKELVDNYAVSYIAGGATQNSIRVAQWMLPANSTAYIGCVGKDAFGKQLRQSAEADGVAVHYLEVEDQPTGTCAVLIHDKERSLVANLAAANHYKPDHLKTDAIKALLSTIDVFYSAGFFLTASPASLMHIAEFAAANDKILAGNISAPFIAQFFTDALLAAVPYYDYLFGNESEAEALGQKLGLADTSVEAVALHLAKLDKTNKSRERVVVITQGSKQTVVASASLGVQSFAVPALDQSLIVDLNGAGDAFVGGFLSQLLQGKDLRTCVEAGHYTARHIIQVSGTELKGKADFQPSA